MWNIFPVRAWKIFRDRKIIHDNPGAGRVPVRKKGNNVADARCSRGVTEANGDDETIGDHLLRVFAPDDDKGADGRVHLEGGPGPTCLCGLIAGAAGELDSHFLEMFIPAGRVDAGGVEHPVVPGEQRG